MPRDAQAVGRAQATFPPHGAGACRVRRHPLASPPSAAPRQGSLWAQGLCLSSLPTRCLEISPFPRSLTSLHPRKQIFQQMLIHRISQQVHRMIIITKDRK